MIIRLETTDSTNRYLDGLCRTGEVEEFTTVVAEHQTAGRGQRGNGWESEYGQNLLFSVLLRPTFLLVKDSFTLSMIISEALCDVLNGLAEGFRVKWPNDIYYGDRKVAGILIENMLSGNCLDRSVVGIGLNVNQTRFVGDAPNPVSLCQVTGRPIEDRNRLLNDLLSALRRRYDEGRLDSPDRIRERYKALLYRGQGLHRFSDSDGTFLARITDVLPSGHLVLTDEQEHCRTYAFKEVRFSLTSAADRKPPADALR
jgi:BirA family biotin operon repressor/biotin-[acetyl-CoA-carboxylase] ligase